MMRKWCLTRYSGQVFHGKLTSILPVVPGGSYQAQGVLQSLTVVPGTDGVLGTIELDPDADIDALPDGIYARWQFTPTISAMFR